MSARWIFLTKRVTYLPSKVASNNGYK